MLKYSLLLLFFLSSCGYHVSSINEETSIYVPYVKGDDDGRLTNAIIYELATGSIFQYKQSQSDFILKVSVQPTTNEYIGYKHDRTRDDAVKKNILPVEGRQKIIATVSLISNSSNKIIWGPTTITADVDYDFIDQDSVNDLTFIDTNNIRRNVIDYSLGQLESVPSAKQASSSLLYDKLAKRIIEILSAELEGEL